MAMVNTFDSVGQNDQSLAYRDIGKYEANNEQITLLRSR